MAGKADAKIKLLYLYDIFYLYTDSEHVLSAAQLCEKLALYGVEAERKSVYKDIDVLRKFGMDIVTNTSPRGYYLGMRIVRAEQIRLIIDAIKYAPFISKQVQDDLFQKAQIITGPSSSRILYEYVAVPPHDSEQREVSEILGLVVSAISATKQISFEYSVFYPRLASVRMQSVTAEPVAVVCIGGRYRIVCRERGELRAFFAERMFNVMVLTLDSAAPAEILKQAGFEGLEEYEHEMLGIVKKSEIELLASPEGAKEIFERFDTRAVYASTPEGRIAVRMEAKKDEEFFGWLMTMGKKITVKAPESLRREIAEKARELLENHD